MPIPPVDILVSRLTARPDRADALVHLEEIPARAAQVVDWPGWLSTDVRESFVGAGITQPWRHQVDAAALAREGHHVVVATGTASGKSLAYLMPALSAITGSRGDKGQRGATALYLSPTKALAHDQADALGRLAVPGLRISTHDGDSSKEQRQWTRDHAEYVLTNPDMLHHSLLPGHERWSGFFAALQYVVIDEVHHYRGVFGSHVAQVVRRLRRICAAHGSDPTFVLASATVAEPAESARRLTGLDVTAVDHDGSPHGRSTLLLWEPPFVAGVGENGAPVRRSATAEVADLLTDLVVERVRTLAFVASRRGTETIARTSRRQLAEVDASLSGQVAAYRGGYLPEERRELEEALRDGRLTGVASTSALELGVDISGLDAVLMAGFPGTRAGLWQQLGRAGRGGEESLGVLVARDDPLDTYLVHHPEALLGQPVEAFVLDPDNPYVLGPHLCAAAAEIPLTEDGPADLAIFGPGAREAVDALTAAGLLRRRPRGWFWTDRSRASDLADIRSSGGPPVRLVEEATGRVIGTVDHSAAPGTAHEGAVYLHQGETWLVTGLDLDESVATIVASDPGHTTSAREITDITVVAERSALAWSSGRLAFGDVCVTRQVVSYLKRRQPGNEVIGEVPLDLPEQVLQTRAVWWTVPPDVLERAGLQGRDLPGAAHAAEHASIGLLPLFATCDRWDIGGVSTALHPDTGELTVFVYDGHPGGAGFAERGFGSARRWLAATRDAIADCGCTDGCPSCVQSPKCGNQNSPLDKAGAVLLLDTLLG
ncbi:DEAD/DEAH box helicase [Nocardioides terrisoli]|uniref:DEAD/DEAH box helicase n=1 Tax=Nocardioides terrisoli TaxID=3388267 RepID=UPI00287BA1C0|nr:DEAD/DEAH box helicase [Nocardioides marmorisolisilvae]